MARRERLGEYVGAATVAGTGPPRWPGESERQVVVGAEQIELGIGVGIEHGVDQRQQVGLVAVPDRVGQLMKQGKDRQCLLGCPVLGQREDEALREPAHGATSRGRSAHARR